MAVSARRVAARRLANVVFVGFCWPGDRRRPGRPGRHPAVAGQPGDRRPEPRHLHHVDAGGRLAGRPAQRHRRLDHDVRAGHGHRRWSIGILAGTWLAEYAGDSRYGAVVRFLNDVLLSAPSILIGLFVYEILVVPVPRLLRLRRRGRPGPAGRAGDHPHHRGRAEAAADRPARSRASRWARRSGTSSARSSGGGRRAASSPAPCWPSRASAARPRRCCSPRSTTSSSAWDMTQPMASLPVVIFNFALSPYDDWNAWPGPARC